jgi:hypothetical protein
MSIRAHVGRVPTLALVIAVGCGVSSMNELSGDYSVWYAHGVERLTLKTNGTFTQIYTCLENGHATTNSGTWEFKEEDRDILLRDVFVFDDWGARPKQLEKVVWRLRVAKRFDKISLIIGEPGVLEFDKAK